MKTATAKLLTKTASKIDALVQSLDNAIYAQDVSDDEKRAICEVMGRLVVARQEAEERAKPVVKDLNDNATYHAQMMAG